MTSQWLAALAVRYGGTSAPRVSTTPSGALIAYAGRAVLKVHHPRTRRADLEARLTLAGLPALAPSLVPPLSPSVHVTPEGRLATVWPRVDVLDPDVTDPPWAEAGALLARLHTVDPGRVPDAALWRHVGHTTPEARLRRALDRVGNLRGSGHARRVARLGDEVLTDLANTPPGEPVLVHGDWHLGQLGRPADGQPWRLIDVDDLGLGDPAWDLGRPAGFWAAGLLTDPEWTAFLTAYREVRGPAVPPDGDPWPRLELPARAAVVLAACRALTAPEDPEPEVTRALLDACARM